MVTMKLLRRRSLVFVAVAACLFAACLMAFIGFVGMTSLAGF
jgi:hypothetical protein